MRHALAWLFVLLGPFILMTAFIWIAHATHHLNSMGELVAIATSVAAGALVLWRTARTDTALWLFLYVPVVGVAVSFWTLLLHCGLTGDCL